MPNRWRSGILNGCYTIGVTENQITAIAKSSSVSLGRRGYCATCGADRVVQGEITWVSLWLILGAFLDLFSNFRGLQTCPMRSDVITTKLDHMRGYNLETSAITAEITMFLD